MKINSNDFRVPSGGKIDLKKWSTLNDKNWKFSLADVHERKFWPRYMQAYEACLSARSVVPADDKKNARLIVSQIVLDAFNELQMAYPRTSAKRRSELKSIRKLRQKEKL